MRRYVVIPLLTVVTLLGLGAGMAFAADVVVTPENVDEGVQQLTIEVTDFDANTAIWVVPCEVPASLDPADVTPDDRQPAIPAIVRRFQSQSTTPE